MGLVIYVCVRARVVYVIKVAGVFGFAIDHHLVARLLSSCFWKAPPFTISDEGETLNQLNNSTVHLVSFFFFFFVVFFKRL